MYAEISALHVINNHYNTSGHDPKNHAGTPIFFFLSQKKTQRTLKSLFKQAELKKRVGILGQLLLKRENHVQ